MPQGRGEAGARSGSGHEPPSNLAPIFQVGGQKLLPLAVLFVTASHCVLTDALSPAEGFRSAARSVTKGLRGSPVSPSPRVLMAQGIIESFLV